MKEGFLNNKELKYYLIGIILLQNNTLSCSSIILNLSEYSHAKPRLLYLCGLNELWKAKAIFFFSPNILLPIYLIK